MPTRPEELHPTLAAAFNAGDLEGVLGELRAALLRQQPDGRWLIAVDNGFNDAGH